MKGFDAPRRWIEGVRNRFEGAPVLIGHSHSRVIFEAASEARVQLAGFNFWTAPQPALNADRTAFHPEIAKTLARGSVFSAVGGAAHNVLAMVRHPRAFDFVLPERPDLPIAPGAEVLPVGAVRGAMAAAVAPYLEVIGLVCAAASGKVRHIEAPPPFQDDARVQEDVPWMFFPDLTREVAPAALRYKCWRLHSQLVAQFCASRGVEMLPPPPEAVDGSGYLKPDYYADAMHVNTRYGALVLDQIRRAR